MHLLKFKKIISQIVNNLAMPANIIVKYKYE